MDHLLYENHFGLSQAPFNITPDPSFLYPSGSHREGLAQLSYGIRARKGFVVLTGEVGTGKTTLIHALLKDLNGNTQTALIFSTIDTPINLLRSVCEEFGLVDPRQSRREIHDYLVSLNEFLLESYQKGENCALIIDEAQNLSAEVLESVRLLSNFETSKDKLLQILLVGQPELAIRLNSPELRQLKQRVMLRHHLRALSPKDTSEYISSRLKIAGGDPGIFTASALESIYSYSNGIPRLVNVLCDNALLIAYALRKKQIDAGIIREVSEDLGITSNTEVRPTAIRQFGNANGNYSTHAVSVQAGEMRFGVGRFDTKSAAVNQLAKNSAPAAVVTGVFLARLSVALTEAMGPMAGIVLRDQIKSLGESNESFPLSKVDILVESLSHEILDEAMRAHFREQIRRQIPTTKAGS
jgi:type II secretory pathway predicted ATPase ExeA